MKKEHKDTLLDLDTFLWGRGLAREGVGAQKLGMSLEQTRENKHSGRISQEIAGISRNPGRPKVRRCLSTVSGTVLSGESPNFRWTSS